MRATALEFRLRVVLMTVAITLGFWSPWIALLHGSHRVSMLGWLALELSRTQLVSFTAAVPVVIVAGALIAGLGAVLRIWGTAYLGSGIVSGFEMKAGAVMADGPYRYVRNPLYIGSWCMVAAMALIMPVSGAVFTLAFTSVFLLRLVFGEEAFLAAQLGEPYRAYRSAVPRFMPRFRAAPTAAGLRPRWLHAVLAEINPIAVFLTLAVVAWSYNNALMVRTIVVGFGLALVVKGFLPKQPHAA